MGYVIQTPAKSDAAPRPLFPLSPAQVRATLLRETVNDPSDPADA